MKIEEINSGYEKTVVEEARKCALATIQDCLQCLAYFKVDK